MQLCYEKIALKHQFLPILRLFSLSGWYNSRTRLFSYIRIVWCWTGLTDWKEPYKKTCIKKNKWLSFQPFSAATNNKKPEKECKMNIKQLQRRPKNSHKREEKTVTPFVRKWHEKTIVRYDELFKHTQKIKNNFRDAK